MGYYTSERLMYPEVCNWMEQFLRQRHPQANVRVLDTSRAPVYRVLRRLDVSGLPDDWESWDIRVDVLGIISERRSTRLAMVECKISAITLAHLSQLLGYCRVSRPEYAFIISPAGISGTLKHLISVHHRQDILEYDAPTARTSRSVVIARWDTTFQALDYANIITGDDNRTRI